VIGTVIASSNRVSVTLVLEFDSPSVFAGTVSCAAFADGANIIINQQILTATTVRSSGYLAGTAGVTVSIPGLSAMSTYNTYCTVVTINGVASTLSDTLSTKRIVETACCKTVSFSNAPSFVYGDLSQYAKAQPGQYVFSYALSAVPGVSVEVTPVLSHLDGTTVSSSVLSVNPATSTFTATSSNLAGKFVLSASSASLSGSYKITLVPSGTSATQFSNATVAISVISSEAPKPAPILSGAKFANSGGSLLISFDSATNKPPLSCTQLFIFSGASDATCTWVNGTSVRAVLSGSSLAVGTSTVTLRSGLIKAECASGKDCSAYLAAGSQFVVVAAPDSPVVPTVLLTTAAVVSSCDDVVLDPSLSSGAGGRTWTSVKWTVSRADALGIVSVPNVLTALNTFGASISSPLTLTRTLFTPATYTITLTLSNFLNQTASATTIFALDANPNLPIVNILGPSERSISPSDSLSLYTTTTQASCAEKDSAITYKWTVQQNGVTIIKPSYSANPAKFSLLSHSLSPGSVYTFLFEATAKATANTAAITGRASTTVKVMNGAVVVVVVGGYNRQVPTVGQLRLDASPSYDENVLSVQNSGLTFSWSCLFASASRYGESCASVLSVTSSNVLSVDATLLDPTNLYAFQVWRRLLTGDSPWPW
jgi:hypothetical protein